MSTRELGIKRPSGRIKLINRLSPMAVEGIRMPRITQRPRLKPGIATWYPGDLWQVTYWF